MFKKIYFFLFIFIFLYLIVFSSNFSSSDISYNYPSKTRYITSEYGYRILYGAKNFHNGTDFGAPQNSLVYSISSGIVTHAGFLNGYGNSITILHPNGYKSLYAHLSEDFLVNAGDYIYSGQVIAKVGPKYLYNGVLNGNTTGPHLHLTIFDENGNTVNPLKLLE